MNTLTEATPHFTRCAVIGLALLCGVGTAFAAGNVFVTALQAGEAFAPLPTNGIFVGAISALQQQSGDSSPIFIKVRRVSRFVQQSRCGRVVFGLAQPATKKVWPQLGGQLNICEDGLPPLGVCSDSPSVLVPRTATCKDRSSPQDTPEVAAALRNALANGDISPEQLREQILQQHKASKPASGASAASASSEGKS
jgi:hypothetical protein